MNDLSPAADSSSQPAGERETAPRPPDLARDWLMNLVNRGGVSPSQRRVVQYMLGSLSEVAFASTVAVAKAAGVSQPTVTRLATTFGFDGYPEFRSALREIVLGRTDGSIHSGPAAPHTDLSLEQRNLAALDETLSGEALGRASDLLAATSPLGVIGLRASAALAEYFTYFARRVLPNVRLLTEAATLHDSILQLCDDGATSVLIFAMPRYPAATVEAIAFARNHGLSTVVVVDRAFIPFAESVDVQLVAPVGTELLFDSHASVVVLAISLLDAISAHHPQRTQQRLEAQEELVEDWAYRN